MVEDGFSGLLWVGIMMIILSLTTIARGWFGVGIHRELPRLRVFAGENLKVLVNLKNTFFIPFLWVRFSDKLPITYILKDNKAKEVDGSVHLLSRRTKTFSYVLEDIPRGKMVWYGLDLFRTDIFGLVEVSKKINSHDELLVYPRYVDIPANLLLNNNHENQGISKLYKGNDYSQISGVREYQRGDKLSLVNWKVSARKGELMSKEFYPPLNQETHILLDCHNTNFTDEYNEEFELQVSIAASLVNGMGKTQRGLTLLFNNKCEDIVVYKSKEYFLSDAMKKLALVQPKGDFPLDNFINENYYAKNKAVNLSIVTNHISEKLLKQFSLGTKNVKATVYYVGEDLNNISKYPFIKHIRTLECLKIPKVRGVANG